MLKHDNEFLLAFYIIENAGGNVLYRRLSCWNHIHHFCFPSWGSLLMFGHGDRSLTLKW